MAEEDEVFDLLRSVIMSQKGGVLLQDLNRDFKSLAGQPIPYTKLGYKSIEGLLDNIPEINRLVNHDGQILYTSAGKNCEHLAELISKQKHSKSAKPKCKTKTNYSKFDETPRRYNKYQPRTMGYRSTTLKTNADIQESEYGENSIKVWKNKHYHYDNKQKDQKNFEGKTGQVLKGSSKSEEEMYAISQRQRECRYPRTNRDQYYGYSFSYEDAIPPLEFRQVNRNNGMNQAHNQNKYHRCKEAHPLYESSARREDLYSDMKQPMALYGSQRCEKEFLGAKHKDSRNSATNHSYFEDQFYEEATYHGARGRHDDNYAEKYSRYQDPLYLRPRNIPDDYELESYSREPFYYQGSYNSHSYGNERKHDWEDSDDKAYHRYMQYHSSSHRNRKIDLVSGSLIVTIKNYGLYY